MATQQVIEKTDSTEVAPGKSVLESPIPSSSVKTRIGMVLVAGLVAFGAGWLALVLSGTSLTLASPGAYFMTWPFTLKWYGFFLVVGFLAASLIGFSRAKGNPALLSELIDAAMFSLIGGMIGARAYYVLIQLDYFMAHPAKIFAFSTGGLTIHGCILGVICGMALYCKVKKVSFLYHLDHVAAIIPLAQALWRFGNFYNSEAFGRPTENCPIKLFIPEQLRPENYAHYMFFEPTFLYEAVWNFGVFVLLFFFLAPRFSHSRPGLIACSYLLLYSIGRLIIEPIRVDGIAYSGVNVPLVASALMAVVALIGMAAVWFHANKKKYAQ